MHFQRDASALSDVNHRTLRKHARSGVHHGSIKMRLRREGNSKSEQFTTRHAKHRRRRKCRNRGSGCAASRNGEINQWRSAENNNKRTKGHDGSDGKEDGTTSRVKENEIETAAVNGRAVRNDTGFSNIAIVPLLENGAERSGYRRLVDAMNDDEDDESWMQDSKDNKDKDDGFLDDALLSSVYMPIDDQIALHDSLATLLTRLFDNLKRNASSDLIEKFILPEESSSEFNEDLCQRWLDSSKKLEGAFLGNN